MVLLRREYSKILLFKDQSLQDLFAIKTTDSQSKTAYYKDVGSRY